MVGTNLWDNFYLDSVFGYYSRADKCKEIGVAILKTSPMKMLPPDKMLLRIKICIWSRFQFVSLAPGKTFLMSKASNNWKTYCQNKNCPMDLS